MFSVFFGQFLLDRNIIKSKDLNALLDISKSTKVKLGVLAINSGLMNVDDVNLINTLQTKEDKKFGELAIEKKLLTNSELEMLLHVQASEHLKLPQTLINENFFTASEVKSFLEEYKSTYSLDDTNFDNFKNGEINTIIDTYLNFENDPFSDLYKEYISLFYKNITRFIDSATSLDNAKIIDLKKYDYVIKQNIIGPKRIYTGYASSKNILIKFAEKFADESFDAFSEYVQDSLYEFLNLNNGLYLINSSDYGVETSLNTQTTAKNYIIQSNKVYRIPIHLSFGDIDLLISLNPIA